MRIGLLTLLPAPARALALAAAAAGIASAQDSIQVQYRGSGWLQSGRVENSSDRTTNGAQNDFNKNWFENAGAQMSAVARISPRWEGALGMGAIQTHHARGAIDVANNWYPYWGTFLGEARISYSAPLAEDRRLQVNLGYFNYNYNPDVKDLGLYLLRGIVYPGILFSGFEARHTTPASNVFGAMGRYAAGSLTNDVLLISETDTRPYFDLSVADVVTWRPSPAFQLGAGVNFYRWIPRNASNTNPGKGCDNKLNNYSQISGDQTEMCYILDTVAVDTAAGTARVDTVLGGLSGTKLMGRFRLDPKAFFGAPGPFGEQDLVLYAEAAVLGVRNYRKYYSDIARRMPVMVGLNLPAFGFLDKLSLEVEYFANPNFHDYGKTESSYSWVPRNVGNAVNNRRDDWKWALYASRIVYGHLRISGQVANDHLRTFGPPDIGYLTYAESLTTPKDWYWMGKLSFFF